MDNQVQNMSFVFYGSFEDAIEKMPMEQGYKVYRAISRYGTRGEMPDTENDLVLSVVFSIAKPLIDAAMKRRENGKKGGKPVNNPNNQSPKPNKPVTNAPIVEDLPF